MDKRHVLLVGLVLLWALAWHANGAPTGLNITYNRTLNYTPQPAASLTTVGGSFTVLSLNVTSQSLRWKAYVGNISGLLTLDDGSGATIYDWHLSQVQGEIYATRNVSFDFSTVVCANSSTISQEEAYLNHTTGDPDSINGTFNTTVHKGFYVGVSLISHSTCPAISTYVNDTRQSGGENARFQEVLLADDAEHVVFAALLESDRSGYDNQLYDFQMIVPENNLRPAPTPYYFYAEIS
jgi:hypothetical protein